MGITRAIHALGLRAVLRTFKIPPSDFVMAYILVHHPFGAPLKAASGLLPAILIEPKGSHQNLTFRHIKKAPEWGLF